MAETKFRLRRKSDGFVTEPITEAQAKTIDGYPGDFEKVEDDKPSRAGYDQDVSLIGAPVSKSMRVDQLHPIAVAEGLDPAAYANKGELVDAIEAKREVTPPPPTPAEPDPPVDNEDR